MKKDNLLYELWIRREGIDYIQLVVAFLVAFFLICGAVFAEGWTDEQIADAIYKAENSKVFPYGIKSIDTKGNIEYARRICLNTIRNQRVRHSKHNCGKDFLTCLWHRYCPPKAHPLNKNWLKNVLYFLNKGGI